MSLVVSFIHSFIQQLHSTHARHAHARVKRESHHTRCTQASFLKCGLTRELSPRLARCAPSSVTWASRAVRVSFLSVAGRDVFASASMWASSWEAAGGSRSTTWESDVIEFVFATVVLWECDLCCVWWYHVFYFYVSFCLLGPVV